MTLNQITLALLSVGIISIISILGIFIVIFGQKKSGNLLVYMVGFATGALFGDVFFHLLPESASAEGFSVVVAMSVLGGILFSFLVEKFIHWRHCHLPESVEHVHPFALMSLVGDAFHNLIDGLIIAVSYSVSIPVGIASTLAIVFHEIPQEIGDCSVLLQGGFSRRKALIINFLISIFAFLGLFVGLVIGGFSEHLVIYLLPFAAGNLLYIAGSDLVPEMHKHVRLKVSAFQFLSVIAGIALMLVIRIISQ